MSDADRKELNALLWELREEVTVIARNPLVPSGVKVTMEKLLRALQLLAKEV